MILKIKNFIKSTFFINVTANIFSYLVAFSGSIIYVHILSQTSFGLYTFANGIIALFLLFNGFGAASGVLQFVSIAPNQNTKLSYLKFAFINGTIFNAVISLFVILYAILIPLPLPNVKLILIAMAFFPITRLYIDVFQAYLRANGQNLLQAQFIVTNSLVLLIANIIGIIYLGLSGLIFSTYIAYLIMFFYSSYKFQLPNILNIFAKNRTSISNSPTLINKREFVHYSVFSTFSNAFSGLLFVLDIIIIGYIVKDPKLIATYKVATIIPFAINFIPNIMVNFYYAQFAKSNKLELQKLIRSVRLKIFIFSAITSLLLVLLAKPLIYLIFGATYHDSILPFQILSCGYWIIATFRIINGNVLAALGKAKLSFMITLCVLILNIIITFVLVNKFSIIGAASAVVIVYIISSVISTLVLKAIIQLRS